eukprot:1162119-Pelagomonas_calceolata.AAC.6
MERSRALDELRFAHAISAVRRFHAIFTTRSTPAETQLGDPLSHSAPTPRRSRSSRSSGSKGPHAWTLQ